MEKKKCKNNIYNSLPWIEKYRPRDIKNVSIDKHIKNKITKMIFNRELPNIILEGPPGVGKTSTIRCIARDIYKQYYKYMVLEMNASDDRGIRIQESIENFRKAYVHIDNKDFNKIAKFKMVILDEADNMTDKAKHIISGFLKNNDNIRFAFTCNTKINIIPSIQSGCHIIKYPSLTDKIIIDRLKLICKAEGIIYDNLSNSKIKKIEKGICAIAEITNGDMRHAINILQLTYNRFGKITDENVYNTHDKPHPEKSKDIIIDCINQNLQEALKKIDIMRKSGYSGTDIGMGLALALRLNICNDIDDYIKIEFNKRINKSLYYISNGMDSSLLQISACVADLCFPISQ